MELVPRKVVIVDMNPAFGDWLEASWKINQKHLQAGEVPLVVYCIQYLASDASAYNGMRARTQQMLMEQWWESPPDSGPEEPISTVESTVVKSSLTLLSWCGDGSKATFPELILDKFDSESEYHTHWKTVCENAKSVLQKLEKSNTHGS